MKSWIVILLKAVGDLCYALIMAIPLEVVRGLFIGIFLLIALWLFLLPAQQPESGFVKRFSDLRWFALGILLLQSAIYLII